MTGPPKHASAGMTGCLGIPHMFYIREGSSWRIIPVSKWLITMVKDG